MAETKLHILVKSLSKIEKKNLYKFIQSPYYNTNDNLIELFNFLLKDKNAFEDGKPNKKEIYQYLFPNKKHKDLHCRQYLTSLTSLIEQFLQIERIQKDKTLTEHALLEEMIDRNSEKLFINSYQKLEIESALKNGKFYYNQFNKEDIKNRFLAHFAQRQNRFIAQPDYTQTIQHLDTFYLIYKLKYCCELLNYKTIGAVEQETILLDEILELLNKKDFTEIPAVSIYHKILLTLTQPENERNFNDLMRMLTKNDHLFPQEETREMYIYAQNFCIRQINKGNTKYLHEILDIYKILLERAIILEKNVLSPWDYKNIVVTALRSKEYDWAEKFIHNYKANLPEKERDNAFTYNFAKYHFYKNNYDQVLDLLQKVEYHDIFYSLDSKAILLKTYFELREFDSLVALMDSFNTFLRRKKSLSEHHVKTYKNLIRMVKKLSKLNNGDKKKAQILLKEIQSLKPLADVGWLSEKANEIMK